MKNSGLSKNGSVQGYISNLIVQLMFLTSGFFVVTVFIHVQVKVIHSESDRRKEHYYTGCFSVLTVLVSKVKVKQVIELLMIVCFVMISL